MNEPENPLSGIEQVRHNLAQLAADDEAAMAGAGKITRDAFDRGVESFIDQQLMGGDPSATKALEGERDSLARYRATAGYATKSTPDMVLSRLGNSGATLGQMANWLVGSTRVGAPSHVVAVAERLREKLGQEEWQALRRATFKRLGAPREDNGKPVPADNQAAEFASFLSGRGSRLAAVLFTPRERDTMAKLANTVRLMHKSPASGRPSEPMPGLAQAIRPYLTTLQGAFA